MDAIEAGSINHWFGGAGKEKKQLLRPLLIQGFTAQVKEIAALRAENKKLKQLLSEVKTDAQVRSLADNSDSGEPIAYVKKVGLR